MPASAVANSGTFTVTTTSDREIRITRLFNAPRHLVFDAMTKPEHIKHWWGALGDGYSVPVCEVDLRVGGKWKFTNRTPTGEMVTFYGVYSEIKRPERLVYTEIYEPYPDAGSTLTAVFTDEGGKTRLTVDCEYPSIEVRDMVLNSGMEFGAAASYDRLEEIAMELAKA
jgi:uncharacterized protein YndB with AHSA1/START domain